jgi:hypothetical protein
MAGIREEIEEICADLGYPSYIKPIERYDARANGLQLTLDENILTEELGDVLEHCIVPYIGPTLDYKEGDSLLFIDEELAMYGFIKNIVTFNPQRDAIPYTTGHNDIGWLLKGRPEMKVDRVVQFIVYTPVIELIGTEAFLCVGIRRQILAKLHLVDFQVLELKAFGLAEREYYRNDPVIITDCTRSCRVSSLSEDIPSLDMKRFRYLVHANMMSILAALVINKRALMKHEPECDTYKFILCPQYDNFKIMSSRIEKFMRAGVECAPE